ncbi:hypothetical protein ACSMX9_28795 [Streptomyces sp. LE64]|uniref:hypothetical protein n=1 Tax=Streptomyces sp. LE64 TaxID=3448653 RepID=UPI00404302D2
MTPPRTPNVALRGLLGTCGWSGGRLAREVNRLGAEAGLGLRYERTSVAQWLRGSRPRDPVPELVVEAFARRLGRRVTTEEAGFAHPPAPHQPLPSAGPLAALVTCDDPAARCGYSLADLVELPRRLGRPASARDRTGPALVRGSVRSLRAMTELFARNAYTIGSRPVRQPLVDYLAEAVAPDTDASARPEARRQTMRAVATLTRICGSVHYDDELHGIAQRAYLTSADLAAGSGDREAVAKALRMLSMQARWLGHYQVATDLARTALEYGRDADGKQRALLIGQLAAASAANGEHEAARSGIREARRQIAEVTRGPDAAVHLVRAHLDYYEALTHYHGDDAPAAIRALRQGVRTCPAGFPWPRAFMLARTAELQVRRGQVEAACASWAAFLDQSATLSSATVDTAVRQLHGHLRPHGRHPAAAEVLRRAALRSRLDLTWSAGT